MKTEQPGAILMGVRPRRSVDVINVGARLSGIGANDVVAVPAALQPPTDGLFRDAVPLFIRPALCRHGFQSSGAAVKRASAASRLSWK